MLTQQEKDYIIGAYYMRDPNFVNDSFVENIAKQANRAELQDCIAFYIANPNMSQSCLVSVAYERNIDNKKLDTIRDATLNIQCGVGTSADIAALSSVGLNINNDNFNVQSMDTIMSNVYTTTYIPTGLYWLDRLVGINGFENGREYVFASRAKGGKSIVLQNIASTLANNNPNKKILYITLENSERDVQTRQNQITVLLNNNMYMLYAEKLTIENIKSISKEYDVIIVDYLARITPSKEYNGTYEMFGDFVDQLHYLAVHDDKLIITAAQLSRAALTVFKNKSQNYIENFLDIDQDAIADSMSIIRNADCVITTTMWDDSQLFNIIASRMNTLEDSVKIEYITGKLQLGKLIKNGGRI